jgi:thiosulfate reductase cytochrome b subunit
MATENKISIKEKHPIAIRWFHWINFPVLAVMIWSGILIYWAHDIYKIPLGGNASFQFFPDGFYKSLGMEHRLAEGMAWHFLFLWIFLINGTIYLLYTFISGQWRYLLPDRNSFREAWYVVLHDLHLSKKPLPERKYNGAQKIAYTGVLVMGVGSIISGIAIYKPVQYSFFCTLCGGYTNARGVHFILTIGYVLFFLVHVSQVIMAGYNNFQAMITGFEYSGNPSKKASDGTS